MCKNICKTRIWAETYRYVGFKELYKDTRVWCLYRHAALQLSRRGEEGRGGAGQGRREHGGKEEERDYDCKAADSICLHLAELPSCVIISGWQRETEQGRKWSGENTGKEKHKWRAMEGKERQLCFFSNRQWRRASDELAHIQEPGSWMRSSIRHLL